MNEAGAKQQIVEKIKSSSNILVTVSTNPSVDELSAALGLTLLLNKMNKHATAVFSGAIPPAITFLDPQKTFENTVDSLRDFIIALDKEKADHLRYKVEGEVVKIFITPYRTTITSDDLDFSQGDYNVELVLALGVKKRDNLDAALTAHGRILHDATVVTMSADQKSELGSVDWYEGNASSLSEMLVSLSDALKTDKPLLDEQIATAFLTGVVAATDRFSNNQTSSKVMTMAAQLMAAGANQQLIAAKLEDANEIRSNSNDKNGPPASPPDEPPHVDGTTDLSEGQSTKVDRSAPPAVEPEPKKNDGDLVITHQTDPADEPHDAVDHAADQASQQQQQEAAKAAEKNLAEQLPMVVPMPAPLVELEKDLAFEATPPVAALSGAVSNDDWQDSKQAPSMGGALNATTEQAAEETRKVEEEDRNRTILTHDRADYVDDSTAPRFQSPLNSASLPSDEAPITDVFGASSNTPSTDQTAPTAYAPSIEPPVAASATPTLADLDHQNRQPHDEALAAVDAAFGAVPFTPAHHPEASSGSQVLGDVNHGPAPADIGLPPLPDFSTLPPLPPLPDSPDEQLPNMQSSEQPEKLEDMFAPAAPVQDAPKSNDPGQFKIPGQQ